MKISVKKNTTAFTTRSLKRVVRRAFDRVGVTGDVQVKFIGQSRGSGGFNFDKGEVLSMPGDWQAHVVQGDHANFWVGPEMTPEKLCSYARYSGYSMRGVTGAERKRMYPTTPADREFLADKPLVAKGRREKVPRSKAERLERERARALLGLKKNEAKARRLATALKKLRSKLKRLERRIAKETEVASG